MAPKLGLKQEEFDEAVKTNVDDFGMEAEEAVAAAIEEFELQGYSLEGIIKTSAGGNTDSHPVALASRELAELANNCVPGAAQQPAQLAGLLERVGALAAALKAGDVQQAVAVAAKEGSVAALLAAAKSGAPGADGADASPEQRALLLPCLRALRLLMQSPACRAALLAEGGPELLQALLRGAAAAMAAEPERGAEAAAATQQLAGAAAALVEAASWQDEDGKCRFVDMGVAADLLSLLSLLAAPGAADPAAGLAAAPAAAAAAGAAAGALRAFATADDERPPASKAFMHARLLAGKPNHALRVLLPALRQLQAGPERPLGRSSRCWAPCARCVCARVRARGAGRRRPGRWQSSARPRRGAPRRRPAAAPRRARERRRPPAASAQIAANDEICKAFGEAGGVAALRELLACATEEGPPELVRAAAAALRQLANSDAVKSELAEAGALATLLRAVRVYAGHAGVQEQLLGTLVALVLRMPSIAAAAAEAGAVDVLAEVLGAAPVMAAAAKAAAAPSGEPAAPAAPAGGGDDDEDAEQEVASKVFGVGGGGAGGGAGAGAAVQRQACMAVRNMAVRNPELRPAFLAAGVEELLRGARAAFPGACKDVAAAALRDLGLDNYNN
ncbi:ARMC6 [Scenedesmus sp. PABB004]|nr:ARMC6 [Scenedesmus sp. PABB004]